MGGEEQPPKMCNGLLHISFYLFLITKALIDIDMLTHKHIRHGCLRQFLVVDPLWRSESSKCSLVPRGIYLGSNIYLQLMSININVIFPLRNELLFIFYDTTTSNSHWHSH